MVETEQHLFPPDCNDGWLCGFVPPGRMTPPSLQTGTVQPGGRSRAGERVRIAAFPMLSSAGQEKAMGMMEFPLLVGVDGSDSSLRAVGRGPAGPLPLATKGRGRLCCAMRWIRLHVCG
ncbi:hypothetical protein ACWD5Q_30585 [Streptomyces sp. NPDC002513]